MAKTLIASSQPVLDGNILTTILQGGITTLNAVSLVTNSGALPAGALPSATYTVAFSLAEDAGAHTGHLLEELYRSLKPGGMLTVIEKDHKDTNSLEDQLLLAGFVGCKRAVSPNGDAMVEAQKPAYQANAVAPLNFNRGKGASSGQGPAAGGQMQKLQLNLEDAENDDEFVDEDALLTEEDLQRPAPAADCGLKSTKKACKDCTCGRAEGQFEKVDLTPEMLENPQSGCGSCGLGDAFRCQSCPYRGLPTFEKGKRIELPRDFLTADA